MLGLTGNQAIIEVEVHDSWLGESLGAALERELATCPAHRIVSLSTSSYGEQSGNLRQHALVVIEFISEAEDVA
ncbi:MAG: hypothetical protein ACOYBP_08670 [Microbacteriaceae bacterium]